MYCETCPESSPYKSIPAKAQFCNLTTGEIRKSMNLSVSRKAGGGIISIVTRLQENRLRMLQPGKGVGGCRGNLNQ